MKIGDLYNFTNNRIRIMMFDNNEVFYQTIKEDDTLVYAESRTISYYRTSKEYFEKNCEFIKHLAFTEKETEIHKPNLPLRLNCFSGLFWTNKTFEKETEFLEFLESVDISEQKLVGLESSKVVIFATRNSTVSIGRL